MAKRATPTVHIHRKLKALTTRVRFLERALKPAKKAALQPGELEGKRASAELWAQHEALLEYFRQDKAKRYLANPKELAAALAHEREINDFLCSKGLKPMPSDIPEQFRRGLKAYQPKADG